MIIAKNRNTFAKRSREMDKKHKADHKRDAKRVKKDNEPEPGTEPTITVAYHPDAEIPEGS